MSLDTLLNSLDRVKSTGPDQWMARCPGHDDRSPSLSVKACDDGRTLIHCFAGCETEDILSAIGLGFSDLMPERIGSEHRYRPVRKRLHEQQLLRIVRSEATLIAIAAENIADGISLSDEDRDRVLKAACRIRAVAEASI